ncbi:MAG: hypothetical protein U1F98_02285 [Verrucomicrobiota bacterium]
MNGNTGYRRLAAEFGPEARFEVRPEPAAPFRALAEDKLERLKERLLRERLNEPAGARYHGHFRRAANDAAALAWINPYPLLVFPGLFEEKAAAAVRHAHRQVIVRQRSLELLAA